MQESGSPRFVQLSHGWLRLHLSFRCLQGPQESGILFLLRTTLYCASGDCPWLEGVVEGGVGAIVGCACSDCESRVFATYQITKLVLACKSD